MQDYPPLNLSESQRTYDQACKHIIAGTTQAKMPTLYIDGEYPIYAGRCEGAYITDIDGNRFLDWIQGLGIILLGHCDPDVNDAAIQEIRQGFAHSMSRPIQNKLAEMLIDIIPSAELVHFFKVGSDATTVAVRLARIFTGREKVIRWGYNGWHDWCCHFDAGIPRGVRDDIYTFEYNNLDSLEAVMKANQDEVCCVLMMPFETELPEPEFLAGVRKLAHEHGALFILDEMRTGFRLAMGGAQEYYGVMPDLATFGKAMSNGYAMSALVGRRDIMQTMHQTHCSSGYAGSSAAIAAAVACVEKIQATDCLPHIWRIGQELLDGLNGLAHDANVPIEAVGAPPMPDLAFKYDTEDQNEQARRAFYITTTRAGVLLHPRHHWYISAAHTDEDLASTLNVCTDAFEAVRRAT